MRTIFLITGNQNSGKTMFAKRVTNTMLIDEVTDAKSLIDKLDSTDRDVCVEMQIVPGGSPQNLLVNKVFSSLEKYSKERKFNLVCCYCEKF